jgi:UDP-GlcNAc:undecaprenyl-phosphate GlcNAc-1-phosphate transferase
MLGQLAIPFSVVAGVGLINAFNMTDGLDGLCGSLALVAIGGVIVMAIANGASHSDILFLTLFAGSIGGFLLFTFRCPGRSQAKVCLGDAGSYLLGFTVLYAVIRFSQGDNRVMPPVSALWFCLLPLLDMGGISVRRILRGLSPFSADREHLHHVFTLAKFSVTATVTMMTAIAIIGVLLSTTFAYLQIAEHYMMAAFALVALLYLWSILRTWKELRFLMRSIDRRVHNVGPSSTVDRRRRSPDGMQSPDAKHPAGKAVGNRTNDGTPSSDLPSTKEA